MPIDLMVGSCRVIDVGAVRRIEPILLQDVAIQPGERLLFRTANSARSWWREPFDRSYVHLSAEAARVLAEAGVGLVGIDALSIGQFEGDGVETHLELLGAGIWVLEGLDLSQVQGGDGELVCLPLRVEGRGRGAGPGDLPSVNMM
jgi:arylformamidase